MTTHPLLPALLGVLLALAAPVAAAAEKAEPPEAPAAAGGAAPTLHGKLQLTLAEAIQMGLENNLDVEVQRFSPFIAHEDTRIAWGAYDPEWFSEFGYASEKSPNALSLNLVGNSAQRTTDGVGGFRGLVPWLGASYGAQLDSQRVTTNSTIQTLSPEYRSTVGFGVTLPLMRDLIWNQAWTRVKTTRILYDASFEDFRRQVMDTVRAIEDGYWNLVASEEQDRVSRKSLETARALLDQTQTQYEVGVVSKVEVTEAEAGVAQREFNHIVANNAYRNAQDVLIDLVLGPGLRADSTLEFAPADRPQDYVAYDIDREQAVRTAFENRPELAIADREIERNRIQLKFARNQRLPQLDVQAGYGFQGLSGDQNPDLFDFRTGGPAAPGTIPSTGYGESYDDYFSSEGAESYRVRGFLSIPLGNTAARHQVSKTELELRRALSQKRRLEQRIILEVRGAVRNLQSAQEGIEAARRARIAAEEQLRSERIRLEYGESTPFDVLLRESDFVQAESEEIGAFRVYRTSAAGLDRAQGTILRSHNIRVDEVAALR